MSSTIFLIIALVTTGIFVIQFILSLIPQHYYKIFFLST